jgi:hypothetical protein
MHPRRLSRPTNGRRIRPAVALAVLGASATLAACGSSASSATSPATTSSSGSSNGTQASKSPQGGGSSRFTALRSCLAKQGITLPAPSGKRPPGGSPGGGGGGLLGGGGGAGRFQPPPGVSATQFQEALKKCGGGNRGAARFNSPTAKTALTKFVACMRENGVNLPAPNTSGNGPVFNTTGINTASSTFTSAQSKCRSALQGVVGGGAPNGGAPNAGTGPPPGEGGAPPSSEP